MKTNELVLLSPTICQVVEQPKEELIVISSHTFLLISISSQGKRTSQRHPVVQRALLGSKDSSSLPLTESSKATRSDPKGFAMPMLINSAAVITVNSQQSEIVVAWDSLWALSAGATVRSPSADSGCLPEVNAGTLKEDAAIFSLLLLPNGTIIQLSTAHTTAPSSAPSTPTSSPTNAPSDPGELSSAYATGNHAFEEQKLQSRLQKQIKLVLQKRSIEPKFRV